MKLDKETIDNLTEGEKWKHFVDGEMWQKARDILANKVIDMQSVNNIETTDAQEALNEIRSRRTAVTMVWEWLKEIEAKADQHETNSQMYQPEEYIRHH